MLCFGDLEEVYLLGFSSYDFLLMMMCVCVFKFFTFADSLLMNYLTNLKRLVELG